MKKRKFTLVELLAAIGIILVLAAIAVGGLSFATSKADRNKTIAIMTEFEMALDEFHKDYGYYPVSGGDEPVEVNFDNDMWKLFLNKTPNKKERSYMEGIYNGKLLDAYGNPFKYQYPNTASGRNTSKFALMSEGPSPDSNDDICNWKQN